MEKKSPAESKESPAKSEGKESRDGYFSFPRRRRSRKKKSGKRPQAPMMKREEPPADQTSNKDMKNMKNDVFENNENLTIC